MKATAKAMKKESNTQSSSAIGSSSFYTALCNQYFFLYDGAIGKNAPNSALAYSLTPSLLTVTSYVIIMGVLL